MGNHAQTSRAQLTAGTTDNDNDMDETPNEICEKVEVREILCKTLLKCSKSCLRSYLMLWGAFDFAFNKCLN